MAKKMRVPKKIAGFKVPKPIRKSPVLKALIGSETGRQVLGNALVAGATAAAAALAATQTETGRKSGEMAGRAAKDAMNAVKNVIAEAAQSIIPGSGDRGQRQTKGVH